MPLRGAFFISRGAVRGRTHPVRQIGRKADLYSEAARRARYMDVPSTSHSLRQKCSAPAVADSWRRCDVLLREFPERVHLALQRATSCPRCDMSQGICRDCWIVGCRKATQKSVSRWCRLANHSEELSCPILLRFAACCALTPLLNARVRMTLPMSGSNHAAGCCASDRLLPLWRSHSPA
jgi:hypothetical protein